MICSGVIRFFAIPDLLQEANSLPKAGSLSGGQVKGTLKDGLPHPAAYDAKAWLAEHLCSDPVRTALLVESFAFVALSGDASAEICSETLRSLLRGEPVSDRYLLGLAWTTRAMEDAA